MITIFSSTNPQSQLGITSNFSTAYWRTQLSCLLFSFVTLLPTAAWADSFSVDIGTLCSFCTSGTLHLDHTIADGFFFSGSQAVITLNTIGDPDFDGTLTYNVLNVSGPAPKILSLINPMGDLSNPNPTLGGIFDFEIGKNGNPNEITFLETRSVLIGEDEFTETQMRSLIFTHEETTTIPEPGTFALFLTGVIGLAGYRWSQRRHELAQVA